VKEKTSERKTFTGSVKKYLTNNDVTDFMFLLIPPRGGKDV
jgi:hypothetical protein